MSITAYVGLPGSGKSYGVVENAIIPALKAGRHVWHNMTLHEESIRKITTAGRLSKVEQGADAETVAQTAPAGAVIVLDEVYKYWPAGKKTDDLSEKQRTFFAEHRHRVDEEGNATEIILIVQDLGTGVCRFVRDLVETTYRAAKLTAVGLKNRYRIDVYNGAATGQRPSEAGKIRSIHGSYQKEIYACYQSHTQSATGAAGKEVNPDDRGNALKSATVKLAIIAVIAIPFVVMFGIEQFKAIGHPDKPKQLQQSPPQSERSEAVAGQSPAVIHPADKPLTPEEIAALTEQAEEQRATDEARSIKETYSPDWRLSGIIQKPDGTGRALLLSPRGRRTIDLAYCIRDNVGEWTCAVDGYTVARWTAGTGSGGSAAVADGSFDTAREFSGTTSSAQPKDVEAASQAAPREYPLGPLTTSNPGAAHYQSFNGQLSQPIEAALSTNP